MHPKSLLSVQSLSYMGTLDHMATKETSLYMQHCRQLPAGSSHPTHNPTSCPAEFTLIPEPNHLLPDHNLLLKTGFASKGS